MGYLIKTHPELAAQLADPGLGTVLTDKSNRKVEWICSRHPDHRWSAVVSSRTAGSGCPYCSNRRVLPGFNDLATTRPDLAAELDDPSLATRITAGSNKKITWRCRLGHTWRTKPVARAGGTGCPYCSNTRVLPGFNDLATTRPDLAAQLVDRSLATRLMSGSGRRVEWRCDLGHTWTASPNDLTAPGKNRYGCPTCSGHLVMAGVNDLATERPDLAAQLADPQPDGTPAAELAARLRPGSNRDAWWVCREHPRPYTWRTSVNNRRAGTGCPVCSQRIVVSGLNDLATTHPDLARQMADPQPDGADAEVLARRVSRGSHTPVRWICWKGHEWTTSVKDRVRGTDCPQCALASTSELENDLARVVEALMPDTAVTRHDLIAGRSGLRGASPSVDIAVPDRGIGIEFNGLYWHSEACGTSATYHRDKSRLAARTGLRLIHVWEDEWLERRSILVRALAHRLDALDRLPQACKIAGIPYDLRWAERLNARSLSLIEIDRASASAFLDTHHIQGPVLLTRAFGLATDQGRLVAVLGLRSPRNNARTHRGPGDWEIQRYATVGLVRGGFTRLLAHAETMLRAENLRLDRWISFSDDSLSDGGMYRAAGFTPEARLRPDYRYTGGIVGRRRAPKERFQRRRFREDPSLVWDESWSEHEAALANGLYRIYDAGRTRWIKDVA